MTDYDRIRHLQHQVIQEQAKSHAHMAIINALEIRIKQLQGENTALQRAKQEDKFTYILDLCPPR